MLNSLSSEDEMRPKVLVPVILVILVVLVLKPMFVYPTAAAPVSENLVQAALICTFNSAAHLSVRAEMIVNRINVFDTVYSRQAIEDMATTNPYVMGAIMLRLHESVKAQVESAFTNSEVDTLNTMPTYQKPYFIDDFQVNLTPAFFQYNELVNLTTFLTAFLDMGATVTYQFNLQVELGWNTTFTYTLPKSMVLGYANTADTNPETNTVTWIVRNWAGNEPAKQAVLSIQSKFPTTSASEKEDIDLEYTLDTRSVNNISFIDSILLKKINVRAYNIIPSFITGLGSLPADGLRLCIINGLCTWTDVFEKTIQMIEQQTTPILENSSLQQSLEFSFQWDSDSTTNCSTPYNITHMDDAPAVRANFIDSDIRLELCQIPAKAFFGLINAGATASLSSTDINFGLGLEGIRYPSQFILRLPSNLSLAGENVYIWNKTVPITGLFTSEIQPNPPYTSEYIETFIEVELQKMDLNIFSAFTGKTELTASTKMRQDDYLYVIRRSDDFSFSPKINISYLNSDVIRLCIQENVFSEGEINAFLSEKTMQFQHRLSEMFHGLEVKGTIDRTVFSDSLIWDGDISAMDDVVPVIVSNYATEVSTVGFNMSVWPAELNIAPQHFILQGLENQTITYRIIFPRGITVNATDSSGKSFIAGTTNDGQAYVELSFGNESLTLPTNLTCILHVSPVYVLSLFLPCILVFLLLVVLVVILYLIRKKKGGLRRGKGKLFTPEDTEPEEYSEQEYYVPPPPPSNRKKR
jgi:hypothetical protein